MAYGVKYELDFSDIKGNKRSIQILKKDYTGEVNAIVGTDNPVIITYTNNDDIYTPIIGSRCTLNLKRTDSITYDEFTNFDEREYKVKVNIGVEDETADIDSPLWNLADTLWEETDFNWATGTQFQVYWEGFLVSDVFTEQVQSNPYDISLEAIDNLGTLDSFLIPDGRINLNTDTSIKTGTGEQTNIDSAWYYIHNILKFTGLDFEIYVQNNIRKINPITGTVEAQNNNVFQDIFINEFGLTDNFTKKNSKEVLENILRITNSRIFQANASWYIISNSNYYDKTISGTIGFGEVNLDILNPVVDTLSVTSPTDTGGVLNGEIKDNKGLSIIERGFYFGTNPLIQANTKEISSDTTDVFSVTKTGLTTGETYYIAAYAKNNTNFEGVGGVIEYTPGASTSSTAESIVPVLQIQNINQFTGVTDTKIAFTAQWSSKGSSNITEYGVYFGTDPNNINNLVKYPIATGLNESSDTGTFTGDTSASPFNLTLTPGSVHYIVAYANNAAGEGRSTPFKEQYTHNVWKLRKNSDNTEHFVAYTSTKALRDEITLSDTGTDCYTIRVGGFLPSLSGLPTITGDCSTTTSEPTGTVETTCKKVSLFRSSTAKKLCCDDPTPRDAFINGDEFLDNTGTTKVYIDSECTTELGAVQFLSEDLIQYRKWNGTQLENKITCQSTSADTCAEDVVSPDAFLVKNEVRGNTEFVQFDGAFSPGDSVVISSDSEFCYDIIEVHPHPITTSITIIASCNIVTTQPPEQCPTMTHFARYLKCGDDVIQVIGNNVDNFPQFVKQISTGHCFSFINRTGQPTSNDEFNLGCSPTSKYQTGFVSCDECLGVTSTTTQIATTTTTQAPSVFFRQYIGILSNCSDDDVILQVKNTENSFPNVITNGVDCFRSLNDGGNGQDGLVTDTSKFPATFNNGDLATDCASCNAFLSTTTTQATTTTQTPCVEISAAVTTSALNACCGTKSVKIYIDSTSITTATTIYTNSDCTVVLGAGNFVHTGGSLFFWNGNTITTATCPACP